VALTPETRLGPYEILSALGVGGMGEVYKARDTRLDRDVAIKILPEAFAADTERVARFQREAKTLAALNHRNIAQIYGLEQAGDVHALVMELVAGEDLSQRIARGAIPIDEALPIARQIAEALEAAHEQGIIHRDLKPANIKVRSDGTVKVLDFGLAKAMEPTGGMSPSMSMSPTITTPAMTQAGVILGSAAYMSPEQARGKTVDKRADIWAFGAVLFEMLTGRRPFDGEDMTEVLGAVVRLEPNWEALSSDVPPPVRTLLQSCLVKDPRHRVADISVALFVMDKARSLAPLPVQAPAAAAVSSGPLVSMAALAVAAVVIIAMAVPTVRHFRETPPVQQSVRFQIPAPGNTPAEMFRLSPDGRYLAFVAPDSGGNRLWVRSLDSLDAKALPGTEGATYPFWSPDNEHVGFFAQGKLKTIAVTGGPPQPLCDAVTGRGGTWNREGEIVFSPGPVGTLYRVSAAGGVPVPATKVVVSGSNEGHRFPEFLPDGRHFLFVIQSPKPEASGLYVGALGGSAPVRILTDDSNAAYAPPSVPGGSGLVLFRRQGTLMAEPFDPNHLRMSGEMFPVAEQVSETGNIGSGAFSVTATGVLAFRGEGGASRELVWMDRTGKRSAALTTPFRDDQADGRVVALSPNEKQVAFTALDGNQRDLFLLNLADGGTSRFTFGPDNTRPIWKPDGTRLVFYRKSSSAHIYELYEKPASGGDAQLLLHLDGVINVIPWDWSPDGKSIVYAVTGEKTASDLWLLKVDGDRQRIPYLQTPAAETAAQFSPDGRWMAYTSNESGQDQVYVQSISLSGDKRQISPAGGVAPKWRHDGTELFYVAPDRKLMAVPVKIADSFDFRTPQPLSVTVPPFFSADVGGYAPARDGQRFLVNVPAGGEAAAAPITVVLNWQAGLPKR
jgi:serine/threonine protein kinase/Tol biopolymer transport system component